MSPLNSFLNNKSKDTTKTFWTNGGWDRRKLKQKVSRGLCDHICSFPTSPSGIKPSWTLSSNGNFDFKTTWEFVRKKKPPVFMVKILHKWIPTPDGLLRRGIIATNTCYCCNGVENLSHLFINGPVAREVWGVFHNHSGIKFLISSNFKLIIANWFGKAKGKIHIFHILPILILWFIWCCRNEKRVDNVPFTAKRVCDRKWKYIATFNLKGKNKRIFWKGADRITSFLGIIPAPNPLYSMMAVRWCKPDVDWWKLNTDGASRGNPGAAAASGVIRDHFGQPIFMFSEYIGLQINNYAEIYAIWRGLEFCMEKSYNKIWIEVDSKIAIDLIERSTTSHWTLQGLILKIRGFKAKMEIKLSHIFREGNAVADYLANHGCEHGGFDNHDISNLKGKICGLIRLDKMSYPYIRIRTKFV
ncbi:hypothetical protein OROMI_018811 [Orobanche minor]